MRGLSGGDSEGVGQGGGGTGPGALRPFLGWPEEDAAPRARPALRPLRDTANHAADLGPRPHTPRRVACYSRSLTHAQRADSPLGSGDTETKMVPRLPPGQPDPLRASGSGVPAPAIRRGSSVAVCIAVAGILYFSSFNSGTIVLRLGFVAWLCGSLRTGPRLLPSYPP